MKPGFLKVLAAVLGLAVGALPAAAQWTDYNDIGPTLQGYETTYPTLCERHDLGLSAGGSRHLWAIRISDNIGLEENEPEFKYIATMHGDEVVGTKMCMNLIEYLLTSYGTDTQATRIVDEIDLWIVPLMNPDGYVLAQRYNINGVDLNRNFPEGTHGDPNTTAGRATETARVMEWVFDESFVASANFHGGALVANYPFDNDGMGSVFSPTPDEDMFVYISEEYSQYNLPMWNGDWYHGITNGAAWYSTDGCMQDWNYRYMGCNEVTLEISDIKTPSSSLAAQFWSENRDSMLAYIETCLIGVRGLVTDASNSAPLAATVQVVGRDHDIFTDPDVGDYHRMLMPGTYSLTFSAPGYVTQTINNVVVSSGDATVLDVQLAPPSPAPVITTASLPDGYLGTAYGPLQLQVSDGQLPLEWSVTTTGELAERDLGSSLFSVVGTAQNWRDDDGVWSYSLPFSFPFYGANYSGIRVWSNGFVDFGSFSGDVWDNSTARLASNKMIAPLWDDLRTDLSGLDIYVDASAPGEVTIRWDAVTYSGEYPTNVSLTLVQDGSMRFHYGGGNTGLTPTIGFSKGNGSDYMLASYDGAGSLTNANSLEFAIPSGMPVGMTLSINGVLSGTPVESGEFQPTFVVTDDLSRTDHRTIPLFIHVGSPADGDYDEDGDVDLADFMWFQLCTGATPSGDCAAAFDFDPDGDVDLVDLAEFVTLLGASGPAK